MEPSTSYSTTPSDPTPSSVVTQRTRANQPDQLPPDTDRPDGANPPSTNQNDAEQQHSAGTSSTTGSFECNICLDSAHDAVVSMCGHLFCWPCLHQWIETPRAQTVCPVCKAAISVEKVIPLYGRGGDHTRDPRSKVPPRPAGQRSDPEPNGGAGYGMNNGLTGVLGGLFGNADLPGGSRFGLSVGIGAFPLTFLFNMGGGGSTAPGSATAGRTGTGAGDQSFTVNTDNESLSKLCFFVALFCLVWLLLA